MNKDNKKKNTIYLAGGMEKAGEYGKIWREEITPHLTEKGYNVWNPYLEEASIVAGPEELVKLKKENFPLYREKCRAIVHHDTLNLIQCKAVAVRIDQSVLDGAGTIGELTLASMMGKDVYAWIDLPNGLDDLPSWLVGCLDKWTFTKYEFYSLIPKV